MRAWPLPVLLAAALFLFAVRPAHAQVSPADTVRADTVRTDSARVDTLRPGGALPADSLSPADTLGLRGDAAQALQPESSGAAPPGGGEKNVEFAARDSLVLVLGGAEGDTGTLFGEAEVSYGEATLEAYRVEILMEMDELRATGLEMDTGTVGRPRFQRGGGEGFTGQSLAFNLQTERGRVVTARTQMQEGFIQGEVVKVLEDSTLYIRDGSYTTCDCPPDETPSYSLHASRMKLQGEWVYTGPIQLFIFNIPTPLWLPLGFLPAVDGRRSGPLPPSYGDDGELGFYLRDWGWYWAINDYMDAQVRFGVWSRGSYQVAPTFRYSKRYWYSGRLQFDYMSQERGERIDPGYQERTSASLKWNHSQTISPSANFSGNVNLSTESYLQTVSESYNDNVRQEINSSINYRKDWGPRDFDIALSHTQKFATGRVDMTLPDISFGQTSFQPFERENRLAGQEERWYERVTTSYRGSLKNQYRFDPITEAELRARGDTTLVPDSSEVIFPDVSWYEALFSPSAYRRATGDDTPYNFSASHRIPVNASFTVNRLPLTGTPLQLSLTPGLSYDEDWFIQTDRDRFVIEEDGDTVRVTETVPGFFALRQFSTSLSANTRFYGLFPVRVGPFAGLRHVGKPSLSFSYRPDFSSDLWGYTRPLLGVDGEPVINERTGKVERYDIARGVRSGESRTLGFSLDNEFQTKRVRTDSTGAETSKVVDLLRLNLSSGYNFAADSLKLSDIRLRARPTFSDDVQLQLSATLSPYAYEDGRQVDRFVIEESFGFVRLTQFSFTASTSFQSERRRGEPARPERFQMGNTPSDAVTAPGELAPPSIRERGAYNTWENSPLLGYADFAIPWSVDLNFNYSYTNTRRVTRRAILGADFDFSLTPRWKVTAITGYDFIDGELASTRLGFLRDFECWQMSFNWVPFGVRQSYGFSLHVKSGKLSNLLRLNLPNSGGIKDRFRDAARQAVQQ